MASERDSAEHVPSLFKAIVFTPLIVVGLLVLLAAWLAMLAVFSWLSSKFHGYRARPRIDGALAPAGDNGMVETCDVGNCSRESSRKSPEVANARQGQEGGGGAEINTEEPRLPANAFTEELVWWMVDF